MKTIDRYYLDFNAFERIKKTALQSFFDGRSESPYLQNCRWWWEKYECTVIFTSDVGHHSGGWWKNPDYERCYHLIWVEPPYSEQGKWAEVWHYRLFCDENWKPIIPRGEVSQLEAVLSMINK